MKYPFLNSFVELAGGKSPGHVIWKHMVPVCFLVSLGIAGPFLTYLPPSKDRAQDAIEEAFLARKEEIMDKRRKTFKEIDAIARANIEARR